MPHDNIPTAQDGLTTKETRSPARELAERLISLSGGAGNVLEAIHCTTRLRLRLRESSRADEAGVSGIPEVQGVFFRAGQLQIILGSANVFKVHRQVVRILQEGEAKQQPEVTGELSQKNLPEHLGVLKQIADAVSFFSDIVVPMIPLFVGVGPLLGLLSMMEVFGWAPRDSVSFRTLSLLTGSAFQMLAVMFGYHTAKRFGGTPPLGAVIGIVMTHPDLLMHADDGTYR